MKIKNLFNAKVEVNSNKSIDDIINIGLFKEKTIKRIDELLNKPEPFLLLTMDDNHLFRQDDEQVKKILFNFILSLEPQVRESLTVALALYELNELKK